MSEVSLYRVASLIKSRAPPKDHRRAMGRPAVGSWGGGRIPMREVALQGAGFRVRPYGGTSLIRNSPPP